MAHGGRYGFANQNAREELPVINLYEIDQLARMGKVEKREGKLAFDFDGKVLGTGSITVPIVVRAVCFSEKAKEKLNWPATRMSGATYVHSARAYSKAMHIILPFFFSKSFENPTLSL